MIFSYNFIPITYYNVLFFNLFKSYYFIFKFNFTLIYIVFLFFIRLEVLFLILNDFMSCFMEIKVLFFNKKVILNKE